MHHLYLLVFKGMYGLGAKKNSVRIARQLDERYCRRPGKAVQLGTALQEFILDVQTFPLCEGELGCGFPILGADDPFHESCFAAQSDAMWDELKAENAAKDAAAEARYAELERQEAEAEHYAELMASFCTHTGCFEPHNGYGDKCNEHDTSCWNCMSDPCVCPVLEDEPDDMDESDDDSDDDRQDDEECPGGCGQTEKTCTCEELASFQRYLAAGSEGYWTP